jgi:hypothetical protein
MELLCAQKVVGCHYQPQAQHLHKRLKQSEISERIYRYDIKLFLLRNDVVNIVKFFVAVRDCRAISANVLLFFSFSFSFFFRFF